MDAERAGKFPRTLNSLLLIPYLPLQLGIVHPIEQFPKPPPRAKAGRDQVFPGNERHRRQPTCRVPQAINIGSNPRHEVILM